jgi:hypothetical protein
MGDARFVGTTRSRAGAVVKMRVVRSREPREAYVEKLEGRAFWMRRAFRFDDEEKFGGEHAWVPCDTRYPADGPPWIAEGDLE